VVNHTRPTHYEYEIQGIQTQGGNNEGEHWVRSHGDYAGVWANEFTSKTSQETKAREKRLYGLDIHMPK
jgi:hypothetical protein